MQEKKLNLLYVAHERKLGGASLSLLALIKEMKKHNHCITVIVPTKNCPVAQKLKELNIPTVPIFMPWWQMPSYWSVLIKLCFRIFYYLEEIEVWYALLKLRKVKIDIVHSNSSVIDYGARIAYYRKCKHVWHIREFGDADYQLEYLRGMNRTWNYINHHADSIIFISKALMQYFHLVVDTNKSIVVYNGVGKEYFIEREYCKKDEVIFLISGNLNRNKRQLLVLQAAEELLRRGEENFAVFIAGTSTSMSESKKYEDELAQYIKENLRKQAMMLGRIDNMNEIRNRADVEIVASNREAFGRVTIEGMFAGMPVIVSDSGANKELVQDGIQGFIFLNDNAISLADRMEMFIKDTHMIEIMGKRAAKYAGEKYTAEKNANEIEQIYYNLYSSSINCE